MTTKRGDHNEARNRFRREIDKHLRKIGMQFNELVDYFKVEEKYFRGAKNNFPDDPKEQKPFSLEFVRQMILACNINPEVFLLNSQELENWKNIKKGGDKIKRYLKKEDLILSKWGLQQTLLEAVDLDYKPGNPARKRSFVRKYLKAVKPHFERANKSIFVSEYLGKGSFDEPGIYMDAYQMAHLAIFRDIEKQLEKIPQLQYRRILRLPPKLFYGRELTESIAQAIKNCSVPTFKHIYHCLHTYSPKQVAFCVAPVSEPIHFGLIEGESKIILTEQYKYIHNDRLRNPDILVPATLLVEKCPPGASPLNTIWNIYQNDINECLLPGALQITKKDIKAMTQKTQDEIHREYHASSNNGESNILDALKANIDDKINFIEGREL